MPFMNHEIWAEKNDDGTATITSGAIAPAGATKETATPTTIAEMEARIATRNGGSLVFPTADEAETAIAAEATARRAGIR